jgi:hypothetical protein
MSRYPRITQSRLPRWLAATDTYARCPSPPRPCAGAPKANDLDQRARSRALQANIDYGPPGAT